MVSMKSTGIVRNIDELGRIVLPKELRKVLDMEQGTPLEIFRNGNQIILQKYNHACILCGRLENRVTLGTSKTQNAANSLGSCSNSSYF